MAQKDGFLEEMTGTYYGRRGIYYPGSISNTIALGTYERERERQRQEAFARKFRKEYPVRPASPPEPFDAAAFRRGLKRFGWFMLGTYVVLVVLAA